MSRFMLLALCLGGARDSEPVLARLTRHESDEAPIGVAVHDGIFALGLVREEGRHRRRWGWLGAVRERSRDEVVAATVVVPLHLERMDPPPQNRVVGDRWIIWVGVALVHRPGRPLP